MPKLIVTIPLLIFTSLVVLLSSCGGQDRAAIPTPEPASSDLTVGVVPASERPLRRQLVVSSELVPFQEIDVYAKESGYVRKLLVDYGTHVKAGQLMAVLEIPELEAQIRQDQASIKAMQDQVANAENQLSRVRAQHKVLHLEYQRLNGVAQAKPGLVAQQEVDDVQGRDLAAEAQVEGAKANLSTAHSNLAIAQSKLEHDQAIYGYSRITAPFTGVVTQRYANYGTLMQAGTNSSTQAMPLVKLAQEDRYRLVIPVPETYVGYVKIGDPVDVSVPALHRHFPGKVARFSEEVHDSTRTMHTEVDVPNPTGILIPGVYAEATLTINNTGETLTVPIEALDQQGENTNVWIVDAANQVQERPVTLGIETANYAEVVSGLKLGDRVIVSDRAGLKPGEQVHPQIVQPPNLPANERS